MKSIVWPANSHKNKLPRVNVSSNSGAPIGLADEISKVFRVSFNDPTDPTDLEYIHLEGDTDQHLKDPVVYEKQSNSQPKIKSVVGRADDKSGVENLQDSGLIARETSATYDEVPTYCYMAGRSRTTPNKISLAPVRDSVTTMLEEFSRADHGISTRHIDEE